MHYGSDGMHGRILTNCTGSLSHSMSILFKTSYNSGLLPGEWKSAYIIPVYKKGPKDDIEDYRPISLSYENI